MASCQSQLVQIIRDDGKVRALYGNDGRWWWSSGCRWSWLRLSSSSYRSCSPKRRRKEREVSL